MARIKHRTLSKNFKGVEQKYGTLPPTTDFLYKKIGPSRKKPDYFFAKHLCKTSPTHSLSYWYYMASTFMLFSIHTHLCITNFI